MLDPVRHFYTVEETKRLIDQMALYKYGKLHWHLIDDEGWRIEIKKYPQLTQQGGWRPKKTYIDSICFARAEREANPTLLPPASKYREINGQQVIFNYNTEAPGGEASAFSWQWDALLPISCRTFCRPG